MSDLRQTSILLPADTYQRLRAEAFRQQTSMSKLIAAALVKAWPHIFGPAETGGR